VDDSFQTRLLGVATYRPLYEKHNRDITIMNRAAVIEQLKQTQEMLARLLALLEAGEGDKFAAHLYQSRREYRRTLRATEQGQQGSRAEPLSQATRSRRASDSMATSAHGSTAEDSE